MIKKKKTYDRINLNTNEIFDGIKYFLNVLDENEIAIDEITLDITHEKTGKSSKIHLFKDFLKLMKQLADQYNKNHNNSKILS